uniref:Neurotransmitter-gated ion-channel ligand-binding domain-containing protein n=1 Tax=Meloidogyne incognita TaxID=6306 RepID=A0A914MUC9_MELIC
MKSTNNAPITQRKDFSSPHQRLLSELFHNYDKRLQPVGENKFSKTVHINVTIVLGILIEMRENEQVAAYVISHIQERDICEHDKCEHDK